MRIEEIVFLLSVDDEEGQKLMDAEKKKLAETFKGMEHIKKNWRRA